jgi:hypothetical protein
VGQVKEEAGDLFLQPCDALAIPTNGTLKKNNYAVMGKGVALQAAQIWRQAPAQLGAVIRFGGGNIVHLLEKPGDKRKWLSFPTKHQWFDKQADLALIKRSCQQLKNMADDLQWKRVCLPRPGCGAGGLKWENVKPVCEEFFDDRFVIVEIPGAGAPHSNPAKAYRPW